MTASHVLAVCVSALARWRTWSFAVVRHCVGALKSEVQHLTRGKVLHDSNEEVRAFAA